MWRCLCSTTLTLLCRVQKWKHRSPNSRVNTQDTKFCVYINVFVLYFYRILCLLFHFDSKKFDWNSPSPSFESRDSRFVDSILLIVVGNPLQFHRIWDLWTLCPRRFFFLSTKGVQNYHPLGRILEVNVPGIKIQPKHTCERRSRGMQSHDTIWKRVSSREKIGEKIEDPRRQHLYRKIFSRWLDKIGNLSAIFRRRNRFANRVPIAVTTGHRMRAYSSS